MRRVSDKRRNPRYSGSGLWGRLKIDGALAEAVIENVSLGGALVGLTRACIPGKNVMLELRGAQRDVRLVGRVVGLLALGRGRNRHGARICFNPSSKRANDELFAIIRGLPADSTGSTNPTDPEAFEFHELKLDADESIDIEIDVEEPEFELIEPADEPTYVGL